MIRPLGIMHIFMLLSWKHKLIFALYMMPHKLHLPTPSGVSLLGTIGLGKKKKKNHSCDHAFFLVKSSSRNDLIIDY